ncbi:MAG: ribonuclease III domain-containing protein [Syntrophomonadaceae bacterium]|nr:ribonuclease III domain-containing protein [Syntrophomonadaceae bacterium]
MHDNLDEKALGEYSPLMLAYIGDAVFELAVRTHVIMSGRRRIRDIHHDTVEVVKAQSQARVIRHLFNDLTEDEQDIVKRGRNAKSTPPRNVDLGDYKMSTGFEALLGFLYLKGDEERLIYFINQALGIDES